MTGLSANLKSRLFQFMSHLSEVKMSKHKFTASKEGSAAYFEALNKYMEGNVLHPDKGFICEHEKACRESCMADRKFHPGQLHHVGEYYALERNGKPFRIVISGAEYGDESECVSIEDRTDEITCLQKCKPSDWNPHMRGTLILLQLLFGKEPENPSAGKEAMSVDVNGRSVNILKTFAMPNFLLCSARKLGDERPIQESASVDVMQQNCAEHYKETLEALKPQIVILQGDRSYGDRSCGFWWNCYEKSMKPKAAEIQHVKVNGCETETLILPLYHPSYPQRAWGGKRYAATNDYVRPAVESLLKEYEKIHG